MRENIFVTGATGMVGYHVVKYLVDRGWHVKAALRSPEKKYLFEDFPADQLTLVECGLDNKKQLEVEMSGCNTAIHCAGAVDPHAKRSDIFAVNVQGTENCIQAASAAGVKQFIHVSSLSVITAQKDQFQVDETAPLRLCGEAYADSKVAAEKLVMEFAKPEINLKVTVLRPGFIYGPMEKAWMPRLISSLQTGKVMLIDGGHKQTNVIYIENLCRAVELSMNNENAYGQVYNLTDGVTPSKKELFDAICDGLHLPRIKRVVPGIVAWTMCEIVSSIAPFLPKETAKKLSRFSRAAYRLAGINQGFSIGKAEKQLGYINRINFNDGIRETLIWFSQKNENETNKLQSTGAAR